jgi:hypothetical protein
MKNHEKSRLENNLRFLYYMNVAPIVSAVAKAMAGKQLVDSSFETLAKKKQLPLANRNLHCRFAR